MSTYVSLLYVFTSVFSLLMYRFNLVESSYAHPSLIATIVYCLLIFLSIYPLYRLRLNKIELQVTPRTERIVKVLTYIFFFNLLLFLYLRFNDIYQIIISGDFLYLRQDIQSDEIGHASGLKGYLGIVTNILSSVSFVMILVFFISVSYLKKSWFFNLIAFLGSAPQVLTGILSINRSNIFYYVVIFGLCTFLFWRKISGQKVARYGVPIVAAFFAMYSFFSAVTISRFDNSNTSYGTVDNSLISYAGMPYTNFCYFFDYYENPDWMSTRYLMPVTNFVLKGYRAGVDREQELSAKTGFNCVAFMTFLGSFMMDSNQVMPFIFMIIYLLLFSLCRTHIRNGTASFVWLLAIFLLAIIPAVGCISYFYTNPFKSMALYILLFLVSKH